MMRSILSTGIPATAVVIALLNGTVIAWAALGQATNDGIQDPLILFLPILLLATCLALSICMFRLHRVRNPLARAAMLGAFVGGFLFLIVLSSMAVPRYSLIAGDGTAYWGLVFLPSLFLGIPALVLGGVVGAAARAVWGPESKELTHEERGEI